MDSNNKLKTLNMCDFCCKEIQSCGASPIFARKLNREPKNLDDPQAVIACSGYENPVDVLREKFH